MSTINRHLDHLVYCVHDLEASTRAFADASGVAPVFGGYHQTQGTKNALVGLGDKCYLEFLAIDPDNETIEPPRWMGIDLLAEPKLTRWAIASEGLEQEAAILEKEQTGLGEISGGERMTPSGKLLRWQLTLPRPEPEVELLPFLIDWSASEKHPADGLPEKIKLLELSLTHPAPQRVQRLFEQLAINIVVKQADTIGITARLETPHGIMSI